MTTDSTGPETDTDDALVDPAAAPTPAPNHGTDSADLEDPASGTEKTENPEEAGLEKAMELIAKAAEKGESSGIAVDALADAIYTLRNSILTRPFWMAWEAMPAGLQRSMAMGTQSEFEKFVTNNCPMLNPRAYFAPGLLLAVLAKGGVLTFKLTTEEETEMNKILGEEASEAAKLAYQAEIQEQVVANIVTPYQGLAETVSGSAGHVAAKAAPEVAAPVVMVAKGVSSVQHAAHGYFANVRERVHALEVAAAQKRDAKAAAEAAAAREITKTAAETEQAAEADLAPEVTLVDPNSAANNNRGFSNQKDEAAAA